MSLALVSLCAEVGDRTSTTIIGSMTFISVGESGAPHRTDASGS
jgi:hypothetical protein